MSPPLPIRRLAEVKAKLKSLDGELRHWEELTNEETTGMRRHHSQIARLATVFGSLTQHVRAEIEKTPAETALLERVESWENEILAAHAIWEVFRSKFVLREDELFRDVLSACDDLLWACYGPAMARFSPDRKGPPLVYFTATWSPFATMRDSNFQNEVRGGSGGMLSDERFVEVIRRLPIPLVSLPWYHAYHLPGALILAHEAGHIVESDFELTRDIADAIDGAALDNPTIWARWNAEIFADLYGCLMMGPPFVSAMMDLLSIAPRSVQNEIRKSGKYPTRALRVELMIEALSQLGHAAPASRLRSEWQDTYGPMLTMTELVRDIPKVVRALCRGPYKGNSLEAIGSFPTGKEQSIKIIAEAASGGFTGTLGEFNDVRLLFAAAQSVHENANGNDPRDAYLRIVKQVVKRGANQYRMRGEPVSGKTEVDADLMRSLDADKRTGTDLRDFLLQFDSSSRNAAEE